MTMEILFFLSDHKFGQAASSKSRNAIHFFSLSTHRIDKMDEPKWFILIQLGSGRFRIFKFNLVREIIFLSLDHPFGYWETLHMVWSKSRIMTNIRYADVCLVVAKKGSLNLIFDKVNKWDKNIKFSYEFMVENKLTFLSSTIFLTENTFEFRPSRKNGLDTNLQITTKPQFPKNI
jgi:hypothetical protein